MLSGHRTSGIIRNAVAESRPLKRSPFGKEFRQIRKRGFLLLCPGCNRGDEKRKGEEKSQLP